MGSRHGQRAFEIGWAYMRNINKYNAKRYGVSTSSTPSLMKAKYTKSVYQGAVG